MHRATDFWKEGSKSEHPFITPDLSTAVHINLGDGELI